MRLRSVASAITYKLGLRSRRSAWEKLGVNRDEIAAISKTNLSPAQLGAVREHLARRLDVGPGHDVLDIGCGHGGFLHHVRSTRSAGRLIGSDVASSMVKQAARKHSGVGLEFVQAPADQQPFADAVFDRVLVHSVLHVLDSKRAAFGTIREVGRVLRPGGVGYVADVPPYGGWRDMLRSNHTFTDGEICGSAPGLTVTRVPQAEVPGTSWHEFFIHKPIA